MIPLSVRPPHPPLLVSWSKPLRGSSTLTSMWSTSGASDWRRWTRATTTSTIRFEVGSGVKGRRRVEVDPAKLLVHQPESVGSEGFYMSLPVQAQETKRRILQVTQRDENIQSKINQPRPHSNKRINRADSIDELRPHSTFALCPRSPAPSRRTARRGPRASATRPASPPTTSSRCRASSASATSSSASPTAPSPTRCTAPPPTSPPPRPWPTGRRCHPGTRAKVRLTCSERLGAESGIVATASAAF